MIPIEKLLHRIRWDESFGRGALTIGYLDRVAGGIVRVPFSEVRLVAGPRMALEFVGDDGGLRTVPLHRIREVWRDGVLIWER